MPKKKTAPEVDGKLLDKVDQEMHANAGVGADQTPPPQEKPGTDKGAAASQADLLQDEETDQAVDDIAAKDADTMLDLQDAIGRKATHVASDLAQQDRRHRRHRRIWFFFLAVVIVVLFLLTVPLTTYTCRWPVGIRLSVTTDILPSVCK